MKRKFLIVFLTTALLFSCSSDDGDSTTNASIVGTWNAIEFNVEQAFDLNEDGTSSNNLIEELPCFENTVTLTADNTYSSVTSGITFEIISATEFTLDCEGTETLMGTYVLEGNTLTVTGDEGTETATATVTNDRLTIVVTDNEDFEGEVTIIYERA